MDGLEMSLDELLALPVSVDLTTAGRAFGLGRTKSFELAQAGEFPCNVLRVGLRYRVPRSALLQALGVDPADARPSARSKPTPQRRGVSRRTGDDAASAAVG